MIELPYGRFEVIGTVSLPKEAVLAEAPEPKKIPWKWIILGGAAIILIVTLAAKKTKKSSE